MQLHARPGGYYYISSLGAAPYSRSPPQPSRTCEAPIESALSLQGLPLEGAFCWACADVLSCSPHMSGSCWQFAQKRAFRSGLAPIMIALMTQRTAKGPRCGRFAVEALQASSATCSNGTFVPGSHGDIRMAQAGAGLLDPLCCTMSERTLLVLEWQLLLTCTSPYCRSTDQLNKTTNGLSSLVRST